MTRKRHPTLPFDLESGPGEIERDHAARGLTLLIGADEAGRGPLAGPVHAAAVCLDPERAPPEGLDDSKKLSERRREALFDRICAEARAFAIVSVAAPTIDRINILQASLAAMHRAVREILPRLGEAPEAVLIDGKQSLPPIEGAPPSAAVVKGDARSLNIAAASILAKVARDRHLKALDEVYPGYGLAGHKGYPTAAHRAAVATLGPTPIHRRSFRGVREHCPEGAGPPAPEVIPIASVPTLLILEGGANGDD